jgi:hypothetical protein
MMKIQWMTAVLLSSALAVGCGDRANENAQNDPNAGTPAAADQPLSEAPPPAVQPAPSPNTDAAQARPDATGARSTTGNRTPTRPRNEALEPSRPATPRVSESTAPAPRVTVRTVTVPAGTTLPLELTTAVSSETAQIEMPVSARLRQDVVVDGVTALPSGAVLRGEVIDVDRAGRVQGRARLGLRFTSVTIGNTREDLRTNPVTFEGEASKGEDATKIGAGAGIGAVIGGIVGGGSGAAKGAAIGGAAGTGAVLATRGKEIELPAGTDITATLASAIDVQAR